ncbi:hypothetical protein L1887_11542 [Cichorium endivia]|nr:hypothetical protein L1887_11542 [Cichorium endivia]
MGVALPVYSTFKAIEAKDPNEQHKWLLYWAVYGSFSVGEILADRFISCCVAVLQAAKQLYMNHLRPFLWEGYTGQCSPSEVVVRGGEERNRSETGPEWRQKAVERHIWVRGREAKLRLGLFHHR